MSTDSYDYLAEGFDPWTLTVPQLRSIFVAHDVVYPPMGKKAQLIDLFNKKIASQASKILADLNTVQPSQSITDASSSQSTAGWDGEAELPTPVADASRLHPHARTRERRRTDGIATSTALGPAGISRPSGQGLLANDASHKHPRETDADVAGGVVPKRPMVRKTRLSEIMQEVPDEQQAPAAADTSAQEDSYFSYDNPFQSGSSPPAGSAEKRARRKRISGGPAVKDPSRRKSSHRAAAAAATVAKDGITVPTAKDFEVAVGGGGHKAHGREDVATVEAGEEFTPDEQLELMQEQAKAGMADILPRRQSSRKSRRSGGGWSAPLVIFLALFTGYALWWRREKLELGYCGVGREADTPGRTRLPQSISALQPECEQCPPHAYCYERLETRCETNFVLKPHPLSLGGLVPLPPTCEPDNERTRKVHAVSGRMLDELRRRRAQYECGQLGNAEARPEMDEDELKAAIGRKRRKVFDDEEFESIWQSSIGELRDRDEVVITPDTATARRALTSTSLAYVGLGCYIRLSARHALGRHRRELVLLALLVVVALAVRRRIRALAEARARVPTLVALTLDRLAVQAALHAQDPQAVPEPWLSAGQLRDDMLRDEFSAQRREELWKRVRTVVEMNANVRASVRESRSGEVSRVWEWIGSVGAPLEDSLSLAERRRSGGGRVSLGAVGDAGSGSPSGLARDQDKRSKQEIARRWDEGRPVY